LNSPPKFELDLGALKSYFAGGFSTEAQVSYEYISSNGKKFGIGDTRKIYFSLNEDCSGARTPTTSGDDTGVGTGVDTDTQASCNAKGFAFDSAKNVCCGKDQEYANGQCKPCEDGYSFSQDTKLCTLNDDI